MIDPDWTTAEIAEYENYMAQAKGLLANPDFIALASQRQVNDGEAFDLVAYRQRSKAVCADFEHFLLNEYAQYLRQEQDAG